MFIHLDDYSLLDAAKNPFMHGRRNIIVIPTNEKCVHGGGLALMIRKGLPQLESISREVVYAEGDYEHASYLHLARTNDDNVLFCLFPTKAAPFDAQSSITKIAQQMYMLADYSLMNDDTIVMPPVGTGLGKLSWGGEVGPLVKHIVESVSHVGVNVVVTTKYIDIASIDVGFGHDLYVTDYLVTDTVDKNHWYGLTEYGAIDVINAYYKLIDAPELTPQEFEKAFTSLRDLGVVVQGEGSRRITQEFSKYRINNKTWGVERDRIVAQMLKNIQMVGEQSQILGHS